MSINADIRIFGAAHEARFHWEAQINDVICTKNWTVYPTIKSAKRAAVRWCRKLEVPYTISVDEDLWMEHPNANDNSS